MQSQAKESKLMGYEMVREIHVESEPFSVENGLLTPSFKSMRPKLTEKYKPIINHLYANMKTTEK